LEPLLDGNLKGIFHCFNGTSEQAKKICDLGFYLGLGGVTTFKNGGLDKVIPDMSLDRIVLETDSPYLAPVPNRGKRNEPSYLPIIGQRVADLLKMSLEELKTITTRNALNLFNS
jgi:TatD DNase family protein